MTALLIGLLLAGTALAAWVWCTGEAVEHIGHHRTTPRPRRSLLIGEEAVLMSDPEWA